LRQLQVLSEFQDEFNQQYGLINHMFTILICLLLYGVISGSNSVLTHHPEDLGEFFSLAQFSLVWLIILDPSLPFAVFIICTEKRE